MHQTFIARSKVAWCAGCDKELTKSILPAHFNVQLILHDFVGLLLDKLPHPNPIDLYEVYT